MPDPVSPPPAAPAPSPEVAAVAPAAVPAGTAPIDPAPQVPLQEAPKDKLGAAYAKLAKEQRAAREAGQKLKAERIALEQQQAEYRAFQESKAEAKRNPLKFLEALGLTYQDLTEAQLAGQGETAPNLELKALKDDLETLRKTQEQSRQDDINRETQQLKAREQEVIQGFQKQITDTIKAAGQKYELVNHFASYETVFRVINESAEQQQAAGVPPDQIRLLSVEEAAAAVESYLETEATKLTALPKYTAKAVVPADPPPGKPAPKSKEHPTRSVTNALTPSIPTTGKGLSAREREQRALETLRRGRQP